MLHCECSTPPSRYTCCFPSMFGFEPVRELFREPADQPAPGSNGFPPANLDWSALERPVQRLQFRERVVPVPRVVPPAQTAAELTELEPASQSARAGATVVA